MHVNAHFYQEMRPKSPNFPEATAKTSIRRHDKDLTQLPSWIWTRKKVKHKIVLDLFHCKKKMKPKLGRYGRLVGCTNGNPKAFGWAQASDLIGHLGAQHPKVVVGTKSNLKQLGMELHSTAKQLRNFSLSLTAGSF